MLATARDQDPGVNLVLVTTLICLAVMFWRVTMLLLCIAALSLLVFGLVSFQQPA